MSNLPERLGESRTPEIMGHARWPIVAAVGSALAFGALSFFGGGAVGVVSASRGGVVEQGIGPPATPLVSGVGTDTSVILSSSAFSGAGSDTHLSTVWELDTLGGDWTATVWRDSSAVRLVLDSLGGITAGASVLTTGVTYKARARHCGTTGGCGQFSDSVQVTATASGNEVLFFSDWSTATGSTAAALLDQNKSEPWTASWGSNFTSGAAVVDSASAECSGWRTENVLQMSAPNAVGQVYVLPQDGLLDTLANGESRFYRLSVCMVSNNFNQTHGVQDGVTTTYNSSASVGSTFWQDATSGAGAWRLAFHMVDLGANDNTWWEPATALKDSLKVGTVYRVEWQVRATSDTTFTLHARVYDEASNTLLLTDPDFDNNRFGDGSLTLTDSTDLPFTSPSGIASTAGFLIGVNGYDVAGSYIYAEYAGFAVCDSDWCGAYPIAGVEN